MEEDLNLRIKELKKYLKKIILDDKTEHENMMDMYSKEKMRGRGLGFTYRQTINIFELLDYIYNENECFDIILDYRKKLLKIKKEYGKEWIGLSMYNINNKEDEESINDENDSILILSKETETDADDVKIIYEIKLSCIKNEGDELNNKTDNELSGENFINKIDNKDDSDVDLDDLYNKKVDDLKFNYPYIFYEDNNKIERSDQRFKYISYSICKADEIVQEMILNKKFDYEIIENIFVSDLILYFDDL